MMWAILTTTLLLAAGPDVSATTLSGRQIAGQLVALSVESAQLQTGNGPITVASSELLSLKPSDAASATTSSPRVWIELIDGSTVVAKECLVAKGVARVTLLDDTAIETSTRSLRSVRLQSHDSDLARRSQLAKQWQEAHGAKASADLIVIRKLSGEAGDDEKSTAVLDQLEGTLGDVTEDKVHFTYEEQSIPVDRAKVEGLLYFHAAGRQLPDPLCRIVDSAGSTWNVKSIGLLGETIQLTSVAGVKAEVPLSRIAIIDYAAGKIAYLSDLEPEAVEWSNAYGATTAALSKLFAPRRDVSFSGEPISIAGASHDKGLALHSRTLVEYRLAGKYSKFLAVAAIDDKVRPAGDVLLTVSVDGKRLGEHRIRGNDEALTLEYDIRGGRKLSLLVDFGGGLDIGDRLHLGSARIIK